MGSDTETEKKKKMALALAPIAQPLAKDKLSKRTLKLVRRGPWGFPFFLFAANQNFFALGLIMLRFGFAASEAKCLKRGVKEVVKSIRRGNKG
jgi:H/ACA ribonucleoprotein complex subunit 2